MLEMRPFCECCGAHLPPTLGSARICSFECTFCADCAETALLGICPNCQGELVPRPRRPQDRLQSSPASSERIVKSNGCPRP